MPRLRRTMIAVLGATLLTATVWAVRGTAAGPPAPAGHGQARHQPAGGQGRRRRDHHPHDPRHGLALLNPGIQGFDVTRPLVLVYERTGRGWQLGGTNPLIKPFNRS